MSKFVITVLEGPERYSRETPQKEVPTQVEARTFKINDQGTIIFTGPNAEPIAAFKHWRDVKPLDEKVDTIKAGATTTGTVINQYPLATGGYVDLDPRGEPRFPLR